MGAVNCTRGKWSSLRERSHPDDAALGVQAGHGEWFHVKHLHIGREGRHLIVGAHYGVWAVVSLIILVWGM